MSARPVKANTARLKWRADGSLATLQNIEAWDWMPYISWYLWTRSVHPILPWCWASVADEGPALCQHWIRVWCFWIRLLLRWSLKYGFFSKTSEVILQCTLPKSTMHIYSSILWIHWNTLCAQFTDVLLFCVYFVYICICIYSSCLDCRCCISNFYHRIIYQVKIRIMDLNLVSSRCSRIMCKYWQCLVRWQGDIGVRFFEQHSQKCALQLFDFQWVSLHVLFLKKTKDSTCEVSIYCLWLYTVMI